MIDERLLLKPETLITVCDKCQQAVCWLGLIMCLESQSAGIKKMTVAQLRALDLEHPDYWIEEIFSRTGERPPP